jgi:hypothetical protein
MTDAERMAEIRAREQHATPAPWETRHHPNVALMDHSVVAPCPCCGLIGDNMYLWDATFIAHARDDVPWLLGRVAALEAELAEARKGGDA